MRPTLSSPASYDFGSDAERQISDWIRQNVLHNQHELGYGHCTKLVIRHISVNNIATGDVGVILIEKELSESGDIERIIKQVVNYAQSDADGNQAGVQKYGVFAYYDKQPIVLRKYFRVACDTAVDPNAVDDHSEPATEKGLVSQLMRHLEATQKTHTASMDYVIECLRKENESLRKREEVFREQQVDQMILAQEVLDNSHARRLEEKKNEMNLHIAEGAYEQLKHLIPVIVNKIAGSKISPESDHSFELLAGLFESMTQEQQQFFFERFLTPPQQAIFAEFLGTYEKQKRQITSGDAPGPSFNLTMFDKRSDLVNADPNGKIADSKTASMEGRVKSFMDAFKQLRPAPAQLAPQPSTSQSESIPSTPAPPPAPPTPKTSKFADLLRSPRR